MLNTLPAVDMRESDCRADLRTYMFSSCFALIKKKCSSAKITFERSVGKIVSFKLQYNYLKQIKLHEESLIRLIHLENECILFQKMQYKLGANLPVVMLTIYNNKKIYL